MFTRTVRLFKPVAKRKFSKVLAKSRCEGGGCHEHFDN
jgi:hypothetical protein